MGGDGSNEEESRRETIENDLTERERRYKRLIVEKVERSRRREKNVQARHMKILVNGVVKRLDELKGQPSPGAEQQRNEWGEGKRVGIVFW